MKTYFEREIERVQRELELDGANPGLHKELGNLFYRTGSLHLAEEEYKTALRVQPDYYEAQYNLGNVYFRMKKPWKAVVAWMEALILKPHLDSARFNIGFAYFNLEEYEDALMEFIRASRMNPESADTWLYQGLCHYELEQYGRARECYLKAMAMGLDSEDLHYNLANTLYAQEKFEESLAHFEKALNLDPEDAHVIMNSVADCLLRLQRLDDALAMAEKAVNLAPEYPQSHCTLAEIHAALDQPDEAKKSLDAVLKLTRGRSRRHENPLHIYAAELARSLEEQQSLQSK